MEALLQKCLFGHYKIFDILKNLYLNKKYTIKIDTIIGGVKTKITSLNLSFAVLLN